MRVVSLANLKATVTSDAALLDAIEEGFARFSAGAVHVAPVVHLGFTDDTGSQLGDTCVKTGFVRSTRYFVVKIASGHAGNAALGLSTSSGCMLVFSQRTGKLEALLHDEGWLTDLRTAVAGAVCARRFAPAAATKLGIVGTGVQARFQLQLVLGVLPDVVEIVVCGRTQAKLDAMLADITPLLSAFQTIRGTTTSRDLRGCAVVITATAATSPVLFAADVAPGTLVIAVGADGLGKQELEPAILGMCELVVVDSMEQCVEFGEASHALAAGLLFPASGIELVELGAVVNAAVGATPAELARARAGSGEAKSRTVVCDLTGVAVQDVIIAQIALAKVEEKEAEAEAEAAAAAT